MKSNQQLKADQFFSPPQLAPLHCAVRGSVRALGPDVMIVPGADDMQLYQPMHKLAYNL
jgi:hypothetical protein